MSLISCEEAVKRLWEYLDGTIEEMDRAKLEEHLSRCRRCCAELEFAELLRGLLARSATEPMPEDVVMRLEGTIEEVEGRWHRT